MELRGERVVLRPLAEFDADRIVELGAHREVEPWWPEKVRFRRIGIARDDWRDRDGVLRDGLPMDLLADELA